jgi:hypothetical protein
MICFPYDYDRIIARSRWYIYDIIDDWKEFWKVDIAEWYDEAQEDRLVRNAMGVTYTAKEYFERKFPAIKNHGCHIPNGGVDNDDWFIEPVDFDSGEKNIVCVSHVGGPWWDWDAVVEIDIACKENGWKFHLVGGGDTTLRPKLGATICYGPMPRPEALGIASRCDVGVIPFKGDICPSVDPIKYHEYLTMGMNTVAGLDLIEMKHFKHVFMPIDGWGATLEMAVCDSPKISDGEKHEHSWRGRSEVLYRYMLGIAFGRVGE